MGNLTKLNEAKRIYQDKNIKTNSKECILAIIFLIENFLNLSPYKEQIKAAKELYNGNIIEMGTGEGKTIVVLIATLMYARDKRKVFQVTANDYLSKRDFDYAQEIYNFLELKSIHFKENEGGNEEEYKSNNIIYATGNTLIFDYLRHIKYERDIAIIDEIDYILVEYANHNFSVSLNDENNKVKMPKEIFLKAKALTDIFSYKIIDEKTEDIAKLFECQEEADVICDISKETVDITLRGYEKINDVFHTKSENLFLIEVVDATLQARFFYNINEQYIIRNGMISIIDSSSGRVMPNGQNDILLQTAIEVKEGLEITNKALLNNTCSFPVFFKTFKTIVGASGTSSYAKEDFLQLFKKDIVKIKSHFKCKRKIFKKNFESSLEKNDFFINLVKNAKTNILIITSSDKETIKICNLLISNNIKCTNLDNSNINEEEYIIESLSKEKKRIVVSSKIVTRGTDVKADNLLVIIPTRFLEKRTEMQALGRTGRNGKEGVCYLLSSKEDKIFALEKKKKFNISEKQINKLQKKYEMRNFESRKNIFIVSYLFFVQDEAINNFIEEADSYTYLLDKIIKFNLENKAQKNHLIFQLKNIINEKYVFNEIHRELLKKFYSEIRPYFQQQFLCYNHLMVNTLTSNDFFSDRCKEYVNQGHEILAEIILKLIQVVLSS